MNLSTHFHGLLSPKVPVSPKVERHFSVSRACPPMQAKRSELESMDFPSSKMTPKRDEADLDDGSRGNYLVDSLVGSESDNEPPPLSSSSSHSPECDFSSETEVLDFSDSMDAFFQYGSAKSSELTWMGDPRSLSRSTTPTGIRPDNPISGINLSQPLSKQNIWPTTERPVIAKELLPKSIFSPESSLISKIDDWKLCCQPADPDSTSPKSRSHKLASKLSSMVESWVTTTDFDCIKSLNPDQLGPADFKQTVLIQKRNPSYSIEKENALECAAPRPGVTSDPYVSEEESELFDSSSDDETLCSDCVGLEALPNLHKTDVLEKIVSPLKLKLVDRVMAELSFTLDARFGMISCNPGGNPSSFQNAKMKGTHLHRMTTETTKTSIQDLRTCLKRAGKASYRSSLARISKETLENTNNMVHVVGPVGIRCI
ncbi:hypothetical protein AOQ84DRAFT_353526, partial [Glonium stellatum]